MTNNLRIALIFLCFLALAASQAVFAGTKGDNAQESFLQQQIILNLLRRPPPPPQQDPPPAPPPAPPAETPPP